MSALPLPSFYDPAQVERLYLERAGVIAEEAARFTKAQRIPPAAADRERIALFGIDVQVAFCTPGASLFVPGAVEDTRRALGFLYRNLDRLTELVFSLDTHRVFQIFHPAWWVGRDGRHPQPMTVVTADEVASGKWTAVSQPEASLEYCRRLEATGKYVLTVWPYHALVGGLSHALVPAVREAALFHAFARRTPTHFEIKGEHPLTENYSVFSPEVRTLEGTAVGHFNTALAERLLSFDRVYVFGQAKSHCVLATLTDLRDFALERDPSLLGRIHILEDAMSPVPPPALDPLPPALDFPKVAEEAFAKLAQAGMKRVRTTEPL